MIRALLVPVLVAAVVAGPSRGDEPDAMKAVGDFSKQMTDNMVKGDAAALKAMLADDWRVLPNNREQRVFLEEAHGVEGQTGPRVFLGAVPFPSPANTSFAPYTIPSSKSQLGGGYDVYITNIRKLPDGRVTFHVGYQFQ